MTRCWPVEVHTPILVLVLVLFSYKKIEKAPKRTGIRHLHTKVCNFKLQNDIFSSVKLILRPLWLDGWMLSVATQKSQAQKSTNNRINILSPCTNNCAITRQSRSNLFLPYIQPIDKLTVFLVVSYLVTATVVQGQSTNQRLLPID